MTVVSVGRSFAQLTSPVLLINTFASVVRPDESPSHSYEAGIQIHVKSSSLRLCMLHAFCFFLQG